MSLHNSAENVANEEEHQGSGWVYKKVENTVHLVIKEVHFVFPGNFRLNSAILQIHLLRSFDIHFFLSSICNMYCLLKLCAQYVSLYMEELM